MIVPDKKDIKEVAKDFEEETRLVLEKYIRQNPTTYIRLYDTRSAGSYMPNQPGDFVAVLSGKANLIECKVSEVETTLVKHRNLVTKNFSDPQIAHMRVWHRAGANCIVLFMNPDEGVIELWDGHYIATVYVTPKMKPETEGLKACFPRDKLGDFLINYMR